MPKSLLALPVVGWFAEAVSFSPSTFLKLLRFGGCLNFIRLLPFWEAVLFALLRFGGR